MLLSWHCSVSSSVCWIKTMCNCHKIKAQCWQLNHDKCDNINWKYLLFMLFIIIIIIHIMQLCTCKLFHYETLLLIEKYKNWKRETWCGKDIDHLTNLCLFVYQWRMYVNLLEALNRAGAPSSIRHSQQPFLVLDGAVRMHRLICPPSAAKRTGRQDLRGVSTHKDRWIGTRKGTLNIQNVTVWAGRPGRSVSTQRAVPCLRHTGSPQFSDTGTRLVVLNVAFSQKQRRTEVGTSAGSHPLKKKKWQ